MNKEELIQWLNAIYITLNRLDIISTANNVKNLSAIYYEFEKVIDVLQQDNESVKE